MTISVCKTGESTVSMVEAFEEVYSDETRQVGLSNVTQSPGKGTRCMEESLLTEDKFYSKHSRPGERTVNLGKTAICLIYLVLCCIMASSLYLGIALSFALMATMVTSLILVGAPVTTNPNTEEVRNATTFALKQFNRMSNDARSYKLIKMISVKSQVVSGINYFLKMKIGVTTCRKNAEPNLEACELAQGDNAKMLICTFKVYVVAWEHNMSLSKSDCVTA